MADYDQWLDDEVRAYLARCDELYPPDAINLDILGQRRVYDEMCAAFDQGRPEGVTVQDEPYGGVLCRRYEPECESSGTVVYYHGGGFVVGGLDSHDSICAEICENTRLRVVAVDYPLAPEHTYPEDFEAAWIAYIAVREAFDGPCVVCGDSAGGNLAAAVSRKGRQEGQLPDGQVLIYPGLGGDMSLPSYSEHAEAPQLTRRDVEFYMSIRFGGEIPEKDPQFAPLAARSFAGLPPTICITAECDPLTSDSDEYVNRIAAAGGKALWINEAGLVHGYLRARGMSKRAADSFRRICSGLRALSEGQWPAI